MTLLGLSGVSSWRGRSRPRCFSSCRISDCVAIVRAQLKHVTVRTTTSMDKSEARAVLADHLRTLRALSYEELAGRVDSVETAEVRAPSGVVYQLEVVFAWDSKPNADVRILGHIDDGGWRAVLPLTDDFIRAPDGTFVGE